MTRYFDHERLDVYRHSIDFVVWIEKILPLIPGRTAARDQLDRASTSISLNIAEGNGKFSMKDRCRFLSIAYGSALECAAALDVLVARNILQPEAVDEGKKRLKDIVSMLIGLINRLSMGVRDDAIEYAADVDASRVGV